MPTVYPLKKIYRTVFQYLSPRVFGDRDPPLTQPLWMSNETICVRVAIFGNSASSVVTHLLHKCCENGASINSRPYQLMATQAYHSS